MNTNNNSIPAPLKEEQVTRQEVLVARAAMELLRQECSPNREDSLNDEEGRVS